MRSIDSTYVIIRGVSTDDNQIGEDVFLSFADGTLLSYSEDLQGDGPNSNYKINLELIDPDGLFLSKIYSFALQQYRPFFEQLEIASPGPEITELGNRDYRKLLLNYVKNTPLNFRKERQRDFDEYAMGSDESQLSEQQIEEDIKELKSVLFLNAEQDNRTNTEEFSGRNVFQEAEQLKQDTIDRLNSERIKELSDSIDGITRSMDQEGINNYVYINVGAGSSKKRANETGYRKFQISKLFMNQDSGRDHIFTLELAPYSSVTEEILPVETASDKDTPKYFPTETDTSPKKIVFKGEYFNKAQYGTIDSVVQNSTLEVNNLGNIVSLIESLLQDYLIDSEVTPIVFLNPILEKKIKARVNPLDQSPQAGKLVAALQRDLADCGIALTSTITTDLATFVKETRRVTPIPQSLILQPITETVKEARNKYSFEYNLKLVITQSRSKLSNAFTIIQALYKKFGVRPQEVATYSLTNSVHKRIFVERLFEKLDGQDEGYGNKYVSISKEIALLASDDTVTSYEETRNKKADISSENFQKGNIPNILLLGDDFFIRSLIFPYSPDFADDVFDLYKNKLMKSTGDFPSLYCNAVKFLFKDSDKPGKGYTEYLEKYSKDVAKFETYSDEFKSFAPDDFSFTLEDSERALLSSFAGRVFIAGEQNSNVISVISRDEKIAFASFNEFYNLNRQKGIKTAKKAIEQKFLASDYTPTDDPSKNFKLSESQINEVVNEVMKSAKENLGITESLERLFGSDIEKSDAVAGLKELNAFIIRSFLRNPAIDNKSISVDGFANYLSFLKRISDKNRMIIVKIQPDLRIHSTTCLGNPAFFFHSNPFISSSRTVTSSLSVLRGLYQIIGYKHVINSSEAYTQVVLLRNQLADLAENILDAVVESEQ